MSGGTNEKLSTPARVALSHCTEKLPERSAATSPPASMVLTGAVTGACLSQLNQWPPVSRSGTRWAVPFLRCTTVGPASVPLGPVPL